MHSQTEGQWISMTEGRRRISVTEDRCRQILMTEGRLGLMTEDRRLQILMIQDC